VPVRDLAVLLHADGGRAPAAFAKAWGRGFSLDNLTLRNVSFVLFDQRATQTAAWHTFVYGGAAALIALAVALAIAYVAHRRLVPFSSGLTYVAMAPFVIPGIVLAIAFYAAYTRPPLVLYARRGSSSSRSHTRFLPIAYANSDAPSGPSTRAGGRRGDPRRQRALALRRVVTPLLQRGLAGAFILVFIPATRELSFAATIREADHHQGHRVTMTEDELE